LVTIAASDRVSCADHEWEKLPLAETIEPATIAKHVSPWPVNAKIEVRTCRQCGRAMARTVRGE
jgi:hypothetical protein